VTYVRQTDLIKPVSPEAVRAIVMQVRRA
jgi:hypothetical protein